MRQKEESRMRGTKAEEKTGGRRKESASAKTKASAAGDEGFLTVELALLMPILFFAIIAMVCADFLLLNKTVLAAQAQEMAVSGTAREAYLPVSAAKVGKETAESKKRRTVTLSAEGSLPGQTVQLSEEAAYVIVRPTALLRQAAAVKEVFADE